NGCELYSYAAFAGICCSGDLRMVEWALQQHIVECELYIPAKGLTLEVLRYLKEKRPELAEKFPLLKRAATRELARVGDLAGLEWARANGFFAAAVVSSAESEGGQLEVLKWAHQGGFPIQNVDCNALARGGRVECLK